MRGSTRSVIVATTPLAAAIVVFGAIYGAGARSVAGTATVVVMSMTVFSGAVQFATVGLLLTGGGWVAILVTAAMLNSRNLLLGAALRPRLEGSRAKRSLLAWWLLDETAALALATRESAARTLLVSGIMCYVAWTVGTVVGALGARVASVEEVAAAVFPVLFVGLAALAATTRAAVLRAAAAAAVTVLLALAVPELRGVIPALAAVGVALPGSRR